LLRNLQDYTYSSEFEFEGNRSCMPIRQNFMEENQYGPRHSFG